MSPPRYSILLPTRDGAPLLQGCIDSVLEQDYEDFELVISNNASQDGTTEILAQYASHPRVRLLQQEELVDVTDNWLAVLHASRGERFTLMGDDDLLLPGYFQRLDALLERHGDPDVLVHNAYTFAYPGLAGSSVSCYQDSFFESNNIKLSGKLSRGQRREIVRKLFRFDFCMTLNMQVTSIARRALELFPGEPFKRPWPDIYCGIGLLLNADSWAISHDRLVVVGVTPQSFGHSAFSAESDDRGRTYLGVDLRFEDQLPGSVLVNGHHETLAMLKESFPTELAEIEIDRHEYVLQQVYAWYYQQRLGLLSWRGFANRMRLLHVGEVLGLPRVAVKKVRPDKVKRLLALGSDPSPDTVWPGMRPLAEISDIGEFARWVQAGEPPAHVAA